MATFLVVCAIGMLIVGGVVAWLIPAWIAVRREHPNRNAILAVNLLLGWTFLGWVVALVWSLSNSAQGQTVVINNQAAPSGVRDVVTASQPVPAELPAYAVGDIVNEHRFYGAQWIPVNPTYRRR